MDNVIAPVSRAPPSYIDAYASNYLPSPGSAGPIAV